METGYDQVINVSRAPRRNWALFGLLGVGVLLVGALFGSAAATKGWFGSGGENKVPIYVSSDASINEQVTLSGGFSAIAKSVTPAVVTINVSSRRQQSSPFFLDPFRDLLPDQDDEGTPRRRTPNQQERQRLRPSGVGSGVIVSPDGYILTNNHVVEGADKVEVELSDRRQFTAKVIGTDPPSDVALVKIDAGNLPVVPFGDSDKVEVGDLVLAVGNPLGIGQTVTMGIISAKGRQSVSRSNTAYEDFLQTDAAINRGNSGGALVNLRGELIGVPSQILSQTGGNIGIGFAIPTKQARNVMDQLLRTGKVRRGKLGVVVGAVTPELADQFNYKGTQGAFVQDVTKGDPADQAGVKAGDIITELQGQRIQDNSQLRNMASLTPPGTTVKFKIWRDGTERELTAKLGEIDLAGTSNNAPSSTEPTATGLLSGVRVENLTPDVTGRIPNATRGVLVVEVDPESNAAVAGLRRGDVIEEVSRQPVANVDEFKGVLQKLGDKKSVLLRVRNAAGARFVVVQSLE